MLITIICNVCVTSGLWQRLCFVLMLYFIIYNIHFEIKQLIVGIPMLHYTPTGVYVVIGLVSNNLWKVNFIYHYTSKKCWYYTKIVFTNTKPNNKLNINFFQPVFIIIYIYTCHFFMCLKKYRLFILNNNYNKSPPRAIATASWLYNNIWNTMHKKLHINTLNCI